MKITPHKHAEVIKAWADGAEIEFKIGCEWIPLAVPGRPDQPIWREDWQYRVKPEPKPNVVTWHGVHSSQRVLEGRTQREAAVGAAVTSVLRIEIDHNDPANPVLVCASLEKP